MHRSLLIFFSIVGLVFSFAATSCRKENVEKLVDENRCDTVNVTYSGTVATIISDYCLGCHNAGSASGGIILDTYADLSNYTTNGVLLGVIRHEAGFSPMPKNQSKMPDCKIRAIEIWIAEGALNN